MVEDRSRSPRPIEAEPQSHEITWLELATILNVPVSENNTIDGPQLYRACFQALKNPLVLGITDTKELIIVIKTIEAAMFRLRCL